MQDLSPHLYEYLGLLLRQCTLCIDALRMSKLQKAAVLLCSSLFWTGRGQQHTESRELISQQYHSFPTLSANSSHCKWGNGNLDVPVQGRNNCSFHPPDTGGAAWLFFICLQTADMESTWYNSTEQNFQLSVLPACALKPWCNLDAVLPWAVIKWEPALGIPGMP